MKFTNLLNGLLLGNYVDQFDTVATPQLAAIEQFNIIKHLGGAAPYIQFPGYGIWPELPEGAEILQVQYMGRHGERFPTAGSGKQYAASLDKLTGIQLNGSLSVLQDYQYYVYNESNYGLETTPSNSNASVYAGQLSAERNGKTFREKYGSLYNTTQTIPVFTSSSQRVHDTAVNFIKAFNPEGGYQLQIISEDGDMGGNSLTPKKGCSDYQLYGEVEDFKFDEFYDDVLSRFTIDNPNLNITSDDVKQLFAACAYEINVEAETKICSIFNTDELLKYEYSVDLDLYYNYGAGNNYTKAIGSVYTKAQLELLTQDSDNKIWLAFTHDDDIITYYASLGLFDEPILPKDKLLFRRLFSKSTIIPQSTRFLLEKFHYKNDTYVRYILNDAVLPIDDCSSGPGFSCQLDDYIDLMNHRINGYDYNKYCSTHGPDNITFYWDYNTTIYNATLKV